MSQPNQQIYFNPFDAAFRANPYPYYKPLLEGPPQPVPLFVPTVVAARYADVAAILRDHEHFSSTRPPIREALEVDPAPAQNMLFADPPDHTRLRRLVSRDFTPKRIREMEPRIRAIANELLDSVAARGEFEVMRDLANPLPVRVIAEMLGVPAGMHEIFKHWSDAIVAAFAVAPGTPIAEETLRAREELRSFFLAEIEKRKRHPGPDLVSALVAAHQEAEALSAEELLAFVILLLLAGNETTTNLIGNGLLTLSRHRDQLERLRHNLELMPTAIEEMLRYDGPVQATVRIAKEDSNVGGTDIKAWTFIFVLLAAANRDPAEFADPETFDITRQPNEHVAFGDGIHFCIGAPLARLEGAIAIGSVLERFPRIRAFDPEPDLTYKGSFSLRGLSSLPLRID